LVDWVKKGKILVNWTDASGKSRQKEDVALLPTTRFLSDQLANELCQKLNVNLLNIRLPDANDPRLSISFNSAKGAEKIKKPKSSVTIGIHGDKEHFQPIKFKYTNLVTGHSKEPKYLLEMDEDYGESYMNKIVPKINIVSYRFKVGETVFYNGKAYKILYRERIGDNFTYKLVDVSILADKEKIDKDIAILERGESIAERRRILASYHTINALDKNVESPLVGRPESPLLLLKNINRAAVAEEKEGGSRRTRRARRNKKTRRHSRR
jgi:hypothetical protein